MRNSSYLSRNRNYILALAVLSLALSVPVFAATDTVTVDVTINVVAQITVVPTSLSWTTNPGAVGGVINITVKNSGSVNQSNLYAYVNTNETEARRPYGIDAASNYSAGGSLVMRNSTSSTSNFSWVQRKEWNWSSSIDNADFSNIPANSLVARGYFKNGTREYIWAVGNGTNISTDTSSGRCNNTATLFAIENDDDAGTVTTRTPLTTGITRDGGDNEYSYFSVDRDAAPINGMCVAINSNCSYILVYRYDKRTSPNFNTCANADFLRVANMTPGDTETVPVDAWVPNGLPDGALNQATVTFSAAGS